MPFAVFAGVAFASLAVAPHPPQVLEAILAFAAVVAACVGLPWSRLPLWAQSVPP